MKVLNSTQRIPTEIMAGLKRARSVEVLDDGIEGEARTVEEDMGSPLEEEEEEEELRTRKRRVRKPSAAVSRAVLQPLGHSQHQLQGKGGRRRLRGAV